MDIKGIHDIFRDVSESVPGLNSFAFGWPFDRTRGADPQTGQEATYPRVFFAVPTATQDTIRQQDTYAITLFFDDLEGYDNQGEYVGDTQLEQWANLQGLASEWVQEFKSRRLEREPDGMAITGNITQGFDSFGGTQRLVTVTLTFSIIVTASCS